MAGPRLDIVDAQPKAVPFHVLEVDAELTHVGDARVSHGIVRDAGNDRALDSPAGERASEVRLGAAVAHIKLARLDDALVPLGRKPHHELAEHDDLLVRRDVLHASPPWRPAPRGRMLMRSP